MKSRILLTLLPILALFFVGCDDDDNPVVYDPIPAAPQGVYSVTGDNAVYLYWNGPYDRDIASYIIWRSFDPIHDYEEVGTVLAESNPDLDLYVYEYIDRSAENGTTYYYAVSSVDAAGHVSELSAENVFDTPRPEGEVRLFDTASVATQAGYSFVLDSIVSYDSPVADVWIDKVGGIFYLNAGFFLMTDFQDMGYTSTFEEIGWAPQDGWSALPYLEIVLGHTYVIWTDDLHFAKLRVESISTASILFQWAYQTDAGNPELKPVVTTTSALSRPFHSSDYTK